MITNSSGAKIPSAPPNIVEYKESPLGHSSVVNGVTCMDCHRGGFHDFRDEVRDNNKLTDPSELAAFKTVYLPRGEMDRLLLRDRARFRAALEDAITTFLPAVREQTTRQFSEPIEPIASIVRYYVGGLELADIVTELEEPSDQIEAYRARFKTAEFSRFDLRDIADGGQMLRESWGSVSNTLPNSKMHDVASFLKIGSPNRKFQFPTDSANP